jgi:hypothetical protein
MNLHVPPLWSGGQSSWLLIQRSGFDTRSYQIFCKVVGLERGPLSLVSTTEELLGRKSSGSVLERREYGQRDPSCWPRGNLYTKMLAEISPSSCGRSVGIVRSRTKGKDLLLLMFNGSILPEIVQFNKQVAKLKSYDSHRYISDHWSLRTCVLHFHVRWNQCHI